MLRDVSTAARQWQVARTRPARDAFAMACLDLADAVDAQTAEEGAVLLPCSASTSARRLGRDRPLVACRLSAREQLLVLGLALEDSSADDRARLLEGPARATRPGGCTAARHYRAAVVRLRGAPPSEREPSSGTYRTPCSACAPRGLPWQLSQTQVVRSFASWWCSWPSPPRPVHPRR